MSNCPLCNLDPMPQSSATSVSDIKPADGLLRRAGQGFQWLVPTALLVLMPKCPLCLAAYFAMFAGIGVSVSTARWMQVLMVSLCVSTLAYVAVRRGRNWWIRRCSPLAPITGAARG